MSHDSSHESSHVADERANVAHASSSPNWWHVFAEYYRPAPATPIVAGEAREGPNPT